MTGTSIANNGMYNLPVAVCLYTLLAARFPGPDSRDPWIMLTSSRLSAWLTSFKSATGENSIIIIGGANMSGWKITDDAQQVRSSWVFSQAAFSCCHFSSN